MNGVRQDRLVKAWRLAKINDLETANRCLEETHLREVPQRFARVAARPLDVHRDGPRNWDEVLSWEEERGVQRDWTAACEGQWYQLDRQHEALSRAGRKVVVRPLRDGRVQLAYRGRKLKWRPLPARPVRRQQINPAQAVRARRPPAASHPRRRPLLRASRAARLGLGGFRATSTPLRSPSLPSPKRANNKPTATNKKGTFSRKFSRGHF